jgi:transposase
MGRHQQYPVPLDEEERQWLLTFINKGDRGARQLKRAHMLWLASDGKNDREVAEALHACPQTVGNIRRKYAQGGLAAALNDRPRPGGERKLTAQGEATLIALACSDPPEGRVNWTMQLLADKLIEFEVVESISDETVRRALKKHPQAVAEKAVVSWQGNGGLYLAHGTYLGPVRRTI